MTWVRFLLAEVVLIFADKSSEGNALVAEDNGSKEESTNDTINETSSSEEEPVKVVSLPELLEEDSLLHDSLLLSGVETASINQTELQPGSEWVTVGLASLVASEVGS